MNIEVLDSISVNGKENYPNEDIVIVVDNYYLVLDGATGLGVNRISNFRSDASWFVNTFKSIFIKNVNSYNEVEELIYATLQDIRAEYLKKVQNIPMSVFEFPSAGMILLYKRNDNLVDIYRLGDCDIFINSNNITKRIFKSSILNKLDDISIKQLKKNLNNGYTPEEARNLIMPTLKKNRSLMNTEDGYWVLSIAKTGFKEIVNNMDKTTIKLSSKDKVLLTTDGYASIIDKYKQDDIFLLSLKDTVQTIRNIENDDYQLLKYPRLKKSDDATALLLKVV